MPLVGVQILLGFVAALFLRANLPIMIALQGISNPFTMPFLYALNLWVGRRVMAFLNIGGDLGPVIGGFHAMFVGGALIGLLAGAVFDLLYRVMLYEAQRHTVKRSTRKVVAKLTGETRVDGVDVAEVDPVNEPSEDEALR